MAGRDTVALGAHLSGNDVVLVALGRGPRVLDRRELPLTRDLPTHPHHHEGSWAVGRYTDSPWARQVSLEEALALVVRVEAAAAAGAAIALATLARDLPAPVEVISLRSCPELPPTAEARIRDNRAQAMADGVMYRQALAAAARDRGWRVAWHEEAEVLPELARRLPEGGVQAFLRELGRPVGAPWRKREKVAAAAALLASPGLLDRP